MAARPLSLCTSNPFASWNSTRIYSRWDSSVIGLHYLQIIGSYQSMDRKSKVYKQLGLFSLKRKIEDATTRVEKFAPPTLEIEDSTRIEQEEMIHKHNLWDDPVKSNQILAKLAYSAKLIDSIKDLKYKAEEAQLISLLTDNDAISDNLIKQAYDSTAEMCKFMDQYEIRKNLKGPFDAEGVCLIITPGSKTICSEMWAEQVLCMYEKWAEKQNYKGRVVSKCISKSGGINSATIELEYEYAYGYLSGERGLHRMICNRDSSDDHLIGIADVDVIPLFLVAISEVQIDEKDLIITSCAFCGEEQDLVVPVVCIHHIPTGISVQSSGERNQFGNKMKALNRLKAKLITMMEEQGVSEIDRIRMSRNEVVRNYKFEPCKLVEDLRTGIQIPNLDSILDGNLGPLILSHIKDTQNQNHFPTDLHPFS